MDFIVWWLLLKAQFELSSWQQAPRALLALGVLVGVAIWAATGGGRVREEHP